MTSSLARLALGYLYAVTALVWFLYLSGYRVGYALG